MTFQELLIRLLAHSAVYFSREDQWPFSGCDEPRNDGKNTATTTQEVDNEQAAGQGGGAGSSTTVVGAGAGAGAGSAGSAGSVAVGAGSSLSKVGGTGNISFVDVSSSDPYVAEAALASNTTVATAALVANGDNVHEVLGVANTALNDEESTAVSAINANVETTVLNDQFGQAALNSAANAEADATTALEATSEESQTTASNALAAAQNETLAGVTPAQEFQSVQPSTPATLDTSKIATWLTIILGVISIAYFLKKGKPS